MKTSMLSILFIVANGFLLQAQHAAPNDKQRKHIRSLIDRYAQAREKKDTLLLRNILTEDVDQLVSTGEWRDGIDSSVKGMLNSSAGSPGTRTLTIKKIRMLNTASAIVDCEYAIENTNGSLRKLWSTFIVVYDKQKWKISAIRNMLPAGQ